MVTASSISSSPTPRPTTSACCWATATAPGYATPAMASAAYGAQVATPTLDPSAGTYSQSQSVTLSDATPGATIYYTTDGSTPTTSSTPYAGPISVSQTTTIRTIATK